MKSVNSFIYLTIVPLCMANVIARLLCTYQNVIISHYANFRIHTGQVGSLNFHTSEDLPFELE